MNIYEMTLNEYLEIASSKSPTPGGGSVSAVVAANACAMVSMVANLTLDKKNYEQYQNDINSILNSTEKIMIQIKELTKKDILAFQNFISAWRLPSTTDDEKENKKKAMESAVKNASLVPLDLCRTCLEILKQALYLAPIGNKSAISDVGVGVYLAEAALKSAMLSVDINLPLISDDNFKANILSQKAKILNEADELKVLALDNVMKRINL